MDKIATKLETLGYRPCVYRIPATEALITEFERTFELRLPPDYGDFLLRFGSYWGNGVSYHRRPTPYGEYVWVECFLGFMSGEDRGLDIRWATECTAMRPYVAIVGDSYSTYTLLLKCSGTNIGGVFLLDTEHRADWTDEKFREHFSSLPEDVERYLALRRSGNQTEKGEGEKHLYPIADSINDLIASMQSGEGMA